MKFDSDQIDELKDAFRSDLKIVEEGEQNFILIEDALLPEGCSPRRADLLLTPQAWGGYSSKLFFSSVINSRKKQNWNTRNVRIGDRNWNSYSWRVSGGLRLVQLVFAHMEALK